MKLVSGRVAFSCERSGLASALLGGYDGSGSWRVYLPSVGDSAEHFHVQVHEAMHHELQISSSWGSIVAMCGVLAKRGFRPHALSEVFDYGVELSTSVHEAYATALADAVGRERGERDPLVDNPLYRSYRARAQALVPTGPGIDESIRMAAIAAVLRCCMQPATMARLAAKLDFGELGAEALGSDHPDRRLAAFEAALVPERWLALLEEMSAADPGHQQRILAERRPTEPDDMARLRAQWEFETKVVQRRCYELTAELLASTGSASVAWADLERVARSIVEAVGRVDDGLGRLVQFAVDAPPPPGADVLEFSRQAVELRPRLPLEVVATGSLSTYACLEGFVVRAGTDSEHVCALWCAPEVLQKQFACPTGALGDPVLFTLARDAHGSPVARVGFLDEGTTPKDVQQLAGDVPVLALSTHYSLTDEHRAAVLSSAEPVYVLLDLPIGWHIDDWVRQGARVRYAVVTVDPARELAALVLSVDRAPHLHFFHVGGMLALGSLFERLRQRLDDHSVIYDDRLVHDDIAGLTLAVSHVLHTFHVLDQDGVE